MLSFLVLRLLEINNLFLQLIRKSMCQLFFCLSDLNKGLFIMHKNRGCKPGTGLPADEGNVFDLVAFGQVVYLKA